MQKEVMDHAVATTEKKPHVIFIPYPGQSHVKGMLKLAELLHYKGLQITFVNTDSVHKSFLESGGPHCLDGSPGNFLFETIPDGVPHGPQVKGTHSRLPLLLQSIETNFLGCFIDLVTKLQDPPTCIISDGFMSVFTIDAAQKLGIPVMMYWTLAACGYMGFYHIQSLFEKGLAPLNGESYITNGYLNTIIDWVPGMEGIRLKDFPVDWTADVNDKIMKFSKEAPQRSHRIPEEKKQTGSSSHGYSLREEEPECLQWLQSKEPNSVIYVNFGSSTLMSSEDLREFGWGLANSNHYFLWIIRSNLVIGEAAALPNEFEEHIKTRGFIASWCSQEKVLNHPSVGGFLTHCGWGSHH
ncbi:putative UDP-glucuronosyl/UDP-glucosyltransferase [Helianthus debilis subsp. tardiflorus]